MEDVYKFFNLLDPTVLLWIACVVAGGFIALVIFDAVRRRRKRGRSHSERRNFFQRIGDTMRTLNREFKRREDRKSRRDDRRK